MNYTRVCCDVRSHWSSQMQVRQFCSGSLILLEDTTGKGHRTRVLGDALVNVVFVQLPENMPRHNCAFQPPPRPQAR